MAHSRAADSTTGRSHSPVDELNREGFLLFTRYLDPAIRNEDIPVRNQFRDLFPEIIPGANMHQIRNFAPANPMPFLLNQVSNMISPIIIDCRDSGWIACNSVVSGLYAKGITQCNFIMMNLFVSVRIAPGDRDRVMRELAEGFQACARHEQANVASSHFVRSQYLWIGGVASSFCHIDDFMNINDAQDADYIVLTKPLGTLIAARYKYMVANGDLDGRRTDSLDSRVGTAYESAVHVMRRSNKLAAEIMKKYSPRAVIDVNGCSLLEAAQELAEKQNRRVFFELAVFPVIQYTPEIAAYMQINVIRGFAPELSGGLLICFPQEKYLSFVHEYRTESERLGLKCANPYIIGRVRNVLPGTIRNVPKTVCFSEDVRHLETLDPTILP